MLHVGDGISGVVSAVVGLGKDKGKKKSMRDDKVNRRGKYRRDSAAELEAGDSSCWCQRWLAAFRQVWVRLFFSRVDKDDKQKE